jgi:hypothetical protein
MARAAFHFAGGPDYCQGCADLGLPCATGSAPEGRRCTYEETTPVSRPRQQMQGRIGLVSHWIGCPKDAGCVSKKPWIPDEPAEAPAALVMRIDLEKRGGPEPPAAISFVHLLADVLRPNGDEGPRESFVLADKRGAKG